MLIVTHRNPILTMVDRVFVLENGQIVADQTPEQLGVKKGIAAMSDVEFKKLAKEMAGKQKNSSSILLLTIITLLAVIMAWLQLQKLTMSREELEKLFRGQKPACSVLRTWGFKEKILQ